ncbi:MAG: translocation/assembly module TamB domain-containing protein, partial [Bacteroidota bacterium]|nr:translocation/assembly module TamB domain-containing protein [Bacteroidota bacterium]
MLYIFVVLFALVFTLYSIFREPKVQTLMARATSAYFSKELKTQVDIRGFYFSLAHGLTMEGMAIKDRNQAYLFRADKLSVVPGRFSYRKHILIIRRVYIENGEFQLLTHKGDSTLNIKFILDYFISKDTTRKATTLPGKPWHFSVKSVELSDTRFHFENENTPRQSIGMDYSNIDANHINLLLTDLKPNADTIYVTIKRFSAVERSGFAVKSMSGIFQISPRFLKANKLKIVTEHCNLDLDFAFIYNSWNAYNDFLNKVNIHADIRPSVLDLQDIGAFAPVLYDMKNSFRIHGNIKGTVNNFRARNFYAAFGENTFFDGNITANGLPDVEETFVDMNIHNLNASCKDIEQLNLPAGAGRISLPPFLENTGIIDVKGNFTGFYNDFVATVKLKSGIGEINTDLKLTKKKGTRLLDYDGELDATALDLGSLFKSGKFGKVSMRADIKGKGFSLDNAALTLNARIDSLSLNKYMYHQIEISGSLMEKKFDGKLNIRDPNLLLDFSGLVDFSDSVPQFNFKSDISKANLFALHLLDRDSVLNLSTRLDVDFKGNDIDNIEGSIKVSDLFYTEGIHVAKMKELTLNTFREKNNRKSYHLRSDFADADFSGEFSFREMIPSLSAFTNNYLVSFKLADSLIHHQSASNQVFKYSISLKNTNPLTEIFVPFLRISDGTRFEGQYNEEKGAIELNGSSPDLMIKNMHFAHWFVHATSRMDNLHVETGSDEFILKPKSKKDTVEIKTDDFKIASDMRDDSIFYKLTWKGDDPGSFSEVGGFVDFTKNPHVELKIDRFNVYLDHRNWDVLPDNLVVFDTTGIFIRHMGFLSEEQHLDINGKISRNPADTLNFHFTNLNISHLDKLLSTSSVDIDGILSGDLKLFDIYGKMRLLSDLRIEKLKFNNEMLGTAALTVFYDNDNQKFDVSSKIIYTGNIGTNIPLNMAGDISIKDPDPRINLVVNLKNLNMKMLNPFVSSFMSQLSGLASGNVQIYGTLSKPVFHGEVKLMRSGFRINYLNVPYSFSDVVKFDTNRIVFNNISIFDSLGNKATLNGMITHNYFHDLKLDLNIDYEDFSAFKNTFAQNNIFYGTARATGKVSITGSPDDIAINVKASTKGGTHVYIPINMTADVSQNEYIIFSNPGEDTLNLPSVALKKPTTGLTLNLGLLVNPSAEVEVYLPDQLGEIKASGRGNLTMEMTPTSSFGLLGTYTLQKGSFLLSLKNLLRLNFLIRDGGRITWTGDPTDANVALNAVYKTRVTLSGLTSDQDKANLRIPVDCIIRMNGRLMNPEISFGMELPNVDEDIKSLVYGAIDTSNASVMNQQMMYVL